MVNSLTAALKQFPTLEICQLLTLVNRMVTDERGFLSEENLTNVKQTAIFHSRLTKKLYLKFKIKVKISSILMPY